jgi:hypothetical protein
VNSNRLTSASAASIEGQLREIRQFVTTGIADLRALLNRDAAFAKTELHSHLSEIRMTPTENREEWHYVVEGNWNLLGTGSNTPVLVELALRMVAGARNKRNSST